MQLNLKSKLEDSKLEIKTFTIDENNIRNYISKKVIDFEDGIIKKALIDLGWTPPHQPQEIKKD